MSDPILVACLVALRSEFNRTYPNRDKGADGWIGDAAHQQESSDHNPDETGRTPYEDADSINEVHALDVDKDLQASGGAAALNADVERIRLAHQTGQDDRLQNIIWQGRIASRSWGWGWHNYTGASQHFDHAHFSARYTTAQESDTSSWGVADMLDASDKTYIDSKTTLTNFATGGGQGSPTGNSVWGHGYPRRAGDPTRQASYVNLQGMQADLDTLKSQATATATGVSAANASISAVRALVNFLGDDFPNDGDPEDDPIVKRLRYVLAHPVA